MQRLFGLFLLPEVCPDSWHLNLTKVDGSDKVVDLFESKTSNRDGIRLHNSAGCVCLDKETKTIEACIAPTLAGWAMLLAPILSVLQSNEIFVMHSAAFVDHKCRGFIFPGNHSSGKTTITLTALRIGCSIVADDILLFRLEGQSIRFLPFLSVLSVEDGNPTKKLIEVLNYYPKEVFQPITNPQFVLLPRITAEARTTAEMITDRRELFRLLLRNVMIPDEVTQRPRLLKILWELAGRASAYRLFLGQDHRSSPSVLNELLEKMEGVGL